ncbi:MAG TPA: glycosyltransferase family 1 protein [Candidatus Brocadiia bacterium]|nr:glycosyltransferase family 1 protein [Candidatus Brocadiia bacterium]
MRIGITTFGADGGKSGISRYVMSLMRELPALAPDIEWEAVVYEDERELFIADPLRTRALCRGKWLRRPVVNVAWHLACLPWLARRRGYDVVFLPAANRRAPVWAGAPSVGTVHDFSSLHVPGKYDRARLFYIKRALPFLARRLTRVLTVSECSKRDIVEFAGVPEDRVVVTPLAADETVFYPRNREEAAERTRRRFGVEPPYILYVSRIEHPGKNHVRLIAAFSRLKEATGLPHRLLLAGSDWTRADAVHAAAAESRWSREIVFGGFAPQESLPDLYCGADLFVFPSLYEGFGLPALEAMCCGTPVVCSNASSMPEVAGDAALMFDPADEEAMASAMRRALTEPGTREDLVRRGLERRRLFSWTETARRTLEALREAAGSR